MSDEMDRLPHEEEPEEDLILEESGLDIYAKPPAEIKETAPTKSWGEYVTDYLTVQEMGDKHQWTLGDIILEMLRATKATGSARQEIIIKFSADVGQKSETVRQYAWVSEAFPKRSDRVTGLSWSHYRSAAKMGEAAMAWIDAAVDGDWSVGRLQDEIKNVEDKASVDNGRPCSYCGGNLPEEGTIFVRKNNQKIAALCSNTCACGFFYDECQKEIKEKEQAAADQPKAA